MIVGLSSTDSQADFNKTIKFMDVTNSVDIFLENVDLTLDRLRKLKGSKEGEIFVEKIQDTEDKKSEKPQNQFKDKIDNKLNHRFIPKITKKFNSNTELDYNIIVAQNDPAKFFEINPNYQFAHPYINELLDLDYRDFDLDADFIVTPPSDLQTSNFQYIESNDQFDSLLKYLTETNLKEIAIDLEHHNYRSYQGFTCLMQISTRDKDFIIDTIKLRDQMQRLNVIFTNPDIVKVLHGANMDIEWLQKDFGIYVVNMFDTGIASRFLKYPMYSLAYLLKYYCKINANKEYQKADWRTRPLTKEMLKYAREDTHYLLFIYDSMRKDIFNFAKSINMDPIDAIKSILIKSREICEKKFEKPELKSSSYYETIERIKTSKGYKKCKLFKAVYKWRDQVARELDESPHFILSNNDLNDLIDNFPSDISLIRRKYKSLGFLDEKFTNDLVSLLNSAEQKAKLHLDSTKQNLKPVNSTFIPVSKFVSLNFENELQGEKFKFLDFNPRFLHQDFKQIKGPKEVHKTAIFKAKETISYSRKFEEITNSFNYINLYDFPLSKYPNLIEELKEHQKNKVKEEKELQNQKEAKTYHNAKLDSADGIITFSEEKGPAPQKKDNAPRLYLDDQGNEIPKSLRDQYSMNKAKRSRNYNKSEEMKEKVKKIKKDVDFSNSQIKAENKFNYLQESDEDDANNFSNKMSKSNQDEFKKFWEKFSNKDDKDPLEFLSEQKNKKNGSQNQKKRVNYKKNQYSRKGIHK